MLSVVIPTYNNAAYALTMARELTEVLQTRFDGPWEVVWVDDASTDSTANILLEYLRSQTGHRLLVLPENLGQYGATVVGIAATRGEWVATMDDDGGYAPHELLLLWEKRHPERVIYGRVPISIPGQIRRYMVDALVMKPVTSSFRMFHASLLPKNRILPLHPEAWFISQPHSLLNFETVTLKPRKPRQSRHTPTQKWKLVLQYLNEYPSKRRYLPLCAVAGLPLGGIIMMSKQLYTEGKVGPIITYMSILFILLFLIHFMLVTPTGLRLLRIRPGLPEPVHRFAENCQKLEKS